MLFWDGLERVGDATGMNDVCSLSLNRQIHVDPK